MQGTYCSGIKSVASPAGMPADSKVYQNAFAYNPFRKMAVRSDPESANMDTFLLNQPKVVYSKTDQKIARHYFNQFNKKRKKEGLPTLSFDEVSRGLYHKDLQLARPLKVVDTIENKQYTLPVLDDMQADGYQDGRPDGQVISNLVYSFSEKGEKARSQLEFAIGKLKRFKNTKTYQKLPEDAKYFLEYKLNQMSSVYEKAKDPRERVKRFGQILNHELTHLYRRKYMPNLFFQTDVEEAATVLDSRNTPWYEARDPQMDQYGAWEYQLANYLKKGNRTGADFLKDGIATSREIQKMKDRGQIPSDVVMPVFMDYTRPEVYNDFFVKAPEKVQTSDNHDYALAA